MTTKSALIPSLASSNPFSWMSFFSDEFSVWAGRIYVWLDPCLMGGATVLAVIGVATSFFQVLINGTTLFGVIGIITAYYTFKLLLTSEDRVLEVATSNLQKTAEGLKTENSRLQQTVAAMTQDLGIARLALNQYTTANNELRASLSSVQAELTKATDATQSLMSTNKQLVDTNAQREKQIGLLQQELDTLGKLDKDAAAQKSAIAQEIQQLAEQKASFEQSAQSLRTSIDELNRLVAAKQTELQQSQTKLAQATQAAKEEEARLTASITAKLSDLTSLAQQVKAKRAELASLSTKS